jgi:hypothetical protein
MHLLLDIRIITYYCLSDKAKDWWLVGNFLGLEQRFWLVIWTRMKECVGDDQSRGL